MSQTLDGRKMWLSPNQYKIVQLSRNKKSKVSVEDFATLNRFKWSYSDGYAVRSDSGKMVKMHRVILGAKVGEFVDHKNNDRLDNRRENLIICDRLHNNRNKSKSQNTSSRYKGVCWDKKLNSWRASIGLNYKTLFIGLYKSERDAARAYDRVANVIFGSSAKTNFHAS